MIEDQLGSQQSQPPRQPSPRTNTNSSSRLPGTDRPPASQSNRGPGRDPMLLLQMPPMLLTLVVILGSATSRVQARGQNGVDRPTVRYEELLAERTSLIELLGNFLGRMDYYHYTWRNPLVKVFLNCSAARKITAR